MYIPKANFFRWLGLAMLLGIIVGISIGLAAALVIQMNILSVELIIPGTAVYY